MWAWSKSHVIQDLCFRYGTSVSVRVTSTKASDVKLVGHTGHLLHYRPHLKWKQIRHCFSCGRSKHLNVLGTVQLVCLRYTIRLTNEKELSSLCCVCVFVRYEMPRRLRVWAFLPSRRWQRIRLNVSWLRQQDPLCTLDYPLYTCI